MSATVKIDIVSAEAQLYSGQATWVFATGELGEVGIAPGHSQLLTALKPGYVRLVLAQGSEEIFYISGGFLEVQPDGVTILADTAIRAHDIDEAAAQAAKVLAEEQLKAQTAELDYATVLADLAQAAAQLQAIQQLRRILK